MFFTIKLKKIFTFVIILILLISITFIATKCYAEIIKSNDEKKYIKWVDFDVPYPALEYAYNLDIKSHNSDKNIKYNWIELLAYTASKYGGNFSKYKQKDIDDLIKRLNNGESISQITEKMKTFDYYLESYSSILGEFVGYYKIEETDENGNINLVEKYGLKVFSPIAKGYPFSDSDDFGVSREYGYKRRHLGHDLIASTGTPVIAIESGTVEELGWNQYGGWRIGIRSFDKKRYYYYAHLRKDYPYSSNVVKGGTITAGDVIGYVGRTGYSPNENVNNIEVSHLHLGMELIFDESQKDGTNQIWIDLYSITKLLLKNKSEVKKVDGTKEYRRIYNY